MARDSAVDAILIAGDVYEHRTVSPEADLIVFEALARLRDTGATIVIIPGNHDSWQRLEALSKLLTPLGILVVPRVLRPAEGGVVEVPSRDGSEAAIVACIPFVPERRFGDAGRCSTTGLTPRTTRAWGRCWPAWPGPFEPTG